MGREGEKKIRDERSVQTFLSWNWGDRSVCQLGSEGKLSSSSKAHLIETNAQFNGDKHKSSYSVRAAGERVLLGLI